MDCAFPAGVARYCTWATSTGSGTTWYHLLLLLSGHKMFGIYGIVQAPQSGVAEAAAALAAALASFAGSGMAA